MRAASSKVSSRRKRRSGANFRLTRRATSWRRILLVPVERLDDRLLVLAAERHHVGGRELEVRRHPHLGDGDDVLGQHLVLQVAAREHLGERMTDQFGHALLALGGPAFCSKRLAIGQPPGLDRIDCGEHQGPAERGDASHAH